MPSGFGKAQNQRVARWHRDGKTHNPFVVSDLRDGAMSTPSPIPDFANARRLAETSDGRVVIKKWHFRRFCNPTEAVAHYVKLQRLSAGTPVL